MLSYEKIVSSLPQSAVTRVEGLPYPRIASGKVREIFDLGDSLLMVASDRLSAFDVILPDGIPGKGIILTQMSHFWFRATEAIIPNHLLADHDRILGEKAMGSDDLALRSMVVKKLRPLPVECVVRGYLTGSGWSAYRDTGEVCGHRLPGGLKESQELNQPIFTPTTKATQGHDEPITERQCAEILGDGLFDQVREVSLRLYQLGHDRSLAAGMILADTKFEFGQDEAGNLYLIDEVLTPDSSRYWPAQGYLAGGPQPSFDKQFVRDFLLSSGWNKNPPAPRLPAEVVEGTRERYLQALRNLIAPS